MSRDIPSTITVDGSLHHLGQYRSAAEAEEAQDLAARDFPTWLRDHQPKSEAKGVRWDTLQGMWAAQNRTKAANGKLVTQHLGYFESESEAISARNKSDSSSDDPRWTSQLLHKFNNDW